MPSLLLLLAGCAAGPPPLPPPAPPPAPALPPYAEVVADLGVQRADLGARWAVSEPAERPAVLSEAREVVTRAILDDLFPQWIGTDWDFYGTTTTPRHGAIACGYFVSTVLEHAGFQVDRVTMAQQASERIILSLVPRGEVQRFSRAPAQRIVDAVHAEGDGLYLLGLDYHVAFLASVAGEVEMCHSSNFDGVVCEDALTSPAMPSDYRVLGKLLADPMMQSWLEGVEIPTVTR